MGPPLRRVVAVLWLGVWMWHRPAAGCEVAAPQHRSPPVGNSIHLRFRETPVWLACDMRDSSADRFLRRAAAADDDYNDTSTLPDVVFRAFDTGTRYECQFEASEARRAELRQREVLPIGVRIEMTKYEDERWFSGELPPFDCTTRRTALPRRLFDLEVRRPPAAEADAALCLWNRHLLRGWRGLDALAPIALEFPDLPAVACAMAPPDNFSAGTLAFTLPGLADPPFVCVFRTYRDFPGLVETQLQRQLDDLQRRLRASQEPQGNHAVRCEDGAVEAPSSSSKVKRVTFTVRAAGGYTARCRFRVSKGARKVSLSDTVVQGNAKRQRAVRSFHRPCGAGYRRSRRGCVPAQYNKQFFPRIEQNRWTNSSKISELQ